MRATYRRNKNGEGWLLFLQGTDAEIRAAENATVIVTKKDGTSRKVNGGRIIWRGTGDDGQPIALQTIAPDPPRDKAVTPAAHDFGDDEIPF